nr:MAG TPA: hypothetical protein [Caudoviricetes sp.]
MTFDVIGVMDFVNFRLSKMNLAVSGEKEKPSKT